jgi:hypothetical protein
MKTRSDKRLPSLAIHSPHLLLEWDFEKNISLDPNIISAGTNRKVWWKCNVNPSHVWFGSIGNRTRGRGCPYCAGFSVNRNESFALLRPELLKEWHPSKNKLNPYEVALGNSKRVHWICAKGHEWSTALRVRAQNDKGCPYCKGRIASEVNSVATLFPDIAKEWHPTKNGKLTPINVTSKSHHKIWWKCSICSYEWSTAINMRTVNSSGCPLCSADEGALERVRIRFEKEDRELPNYDYETDDTIIADAQALRQMLTTQIKIEPELRSIESLLLTKYRYRIDYRPYYQRNYVWDNDKATYFIESVLIGTEVPPLIFFESENNLEVIDGRQRYETLLRFQENEFQLTSSGLAVRKDIANKSFDQLEQKDKDFFHDSKLRLFRFSVVNPSIVNARTLDLLKKEIFRRYNSGITPLRQIDIEKAIYISDDPTDYIKKQFQRNEYLYDSFVKLFLGLPSGIESSDPSLMEKALQEFRFLLVCAEMPILATRDKEVLHRVYGLFSDNVEDVQSLYRNFAKRIQLVEQLNSHFTQEQVKPTKFWNEVVYWALAVLGKENLREEDLLKEEKKTAFLNLYKSNQKAYDPSETQFFYGQFINRYNTMGNYLEEAYGLSIGPYIRKSLKKIFVDEQTNENTEAIEEFMRIEKQDPASISIDDLCKDISRNRYLLRPAYQRQEVINRTKSSSIIESILLGIKLPPLYAFKTKDGLFEIIDGQQRILSILGYLGRPFLNEKGEQVFSQKNNFPLSKLRILDFSGKTFSELDLKLQERITDYSLSIITIDEKFNPNFNPVDLFIRLNSRPYPIKENTFEMWNSYIDKDIIDMLKEVTKKYESWFYITRDNLRMRNEELMTILAYLEYSRLSNAQNDRTIENDLVVFRIDENIGVRIKQKAAITKTLDAASLKSELKKNFEESIKRTDSFIKRLKTILTSEGIEQESSLNNELTDTLNVLKKRWYARRFNDFYALWYILSDIQMSVAIRKRGEIREDLSRLLQSMKDKITSIDLFKSEIDNFKNKYSTDDRKIKLTLEQKKEMINSQGGICPLCNSPVYIADEIAVDHIIPIAAQGLDKKENLQVVHKLCNEQKKDKIE